MQLRLLHWISGWKSLRQVCFQFNRSKEYQSTSTGTLSRYVHWKRSFRVNVNCELWTRSFSYWVSVANKLHLEPGNYLLQEKPIALWGGDVINLPEGNRHSFLTCPWELSSSGQYDEVATYLQVEILFHSQDNVILQTHGDNRSPSIHPLRSGIPTVPAGVYKLSPTSRVIRCMNKYCTRERKMLQLPANKHSGIKDIKNHILSTCCGQLMHRMSPSLLFLSSSSGIFSSFYVLIHVFCRFEIPPVRCFWPRQAIGGKFVEVGQNKKERSRITSDIPTYFYVSHFCWKASLSYQVLFTSLRLGVPTAPACVYKLIPTSRVIRCHE